MQQHRPRPDGVVGGWLSAWDTKNIFLVFCLAHVVVWTLVPALMYQSVPNDTLEGITWGNMWQFGYDKHPFLAPWLSAFFTDLFGTVGWPVYLASQLSVALCFWAIWSLARTILDPWRALVAVMLLEGVHNYNLSSFTLNPNIVMLPTWAMLTLTAYRAMLRPDWARWAQSGLWAGLATLAKYESGILFLVLLIVLVATPQGRRSLSAPGFYVGILVATLVALPNLIWLAQHDFISIRYALGEFHPKYGHPALARAAGHHWYPPLEFLVEQAGAILPALLLFLVFRRRRRPIDWHDFNHQFVFALAVGPLVLTLLITGLAHAHMVARWGFPFFSVLGIALALFFTPEIDPRRMARFLVAVLGLNVVMVAGLYWVIFVRPYHTGKPPYSTTFPTRPLAEFVTRSWHLYYGTRLKYVAGDRYRISGIGAYSADKPIPFFDWDPESNPWLREDDLRAAGAVFVHQLADKPSKREADEALIRSLQARFPRLTREERVAFPQLSKAPLPPARFWIAFLPPGGRTSAPSTPAPPASAPPGRAK